MVTLALGHLLPHEVKPPVAPFKHPKPKVQFDENAQVYDAKSSGGPTGKPVLVDWDRFETLLIEGQFATKVEAVDWCRTVYTMVHDPDDEDTHWDDNSWRRIRNGLFPEALAAFEALPHTIYQSAQLPPRVGRRSKYAPGERLLLAGKCNNDHEIKGPEDLASTGPDENGNPRLGCLHCRRERSREQRQRRAKNKRKA